MLHPLVRFLGILAVLSLASFVFLRLYGVPAPMLREIVRRINAAGIPVQMDRLMLTLRGWRVDGLRYYGPDPDDLIPLLSIDRAYVFFRRFDGDVDSVRTRIRFRAERVVWTPSRDWGVEVPPESAALRIDRMEGELCVFPDRIVLSSGRADWLGVRFSLEGTLSGRLASKNGSARRSFPAGKAVLTRSRYEAIERRLRSLDLPAGADVTISFFADLENLSLSKVDIAVSAERPGWNGYRFSRFRAEGAFGWPLLRARRIELESDGGRIALSGEWNVVSNVVSASVRNGLTTTNLLTLIPDSLRPLPIPPGTEFSELPRFDLRFGPETPSNLLCRVNGSFSLDRFSYKGLRVASLSGRVERVGRRLRFDALRARSRSGDEVEGSFFWKGDVREYGVDARGRLDPRTLMGPLDFVSIATNIIGRFSLRSASPTGRVRIRHSLDRAGSFQIAVDARGKDVLYEGVAFDSLALKAAYRDGILRLNEIEGRRGEETASGDVSIDFLESTAQFDVSTTMSFGEIEDVVWKPLGLFGTEIRSEGRRQIVAKGRFDWGTMRRTDFSATVSCDRLVLPPATLSGFRAQVLGSGPLISVRDASFDLSGGAGTGVFSMAWIPCRKTLPYVVDCSLHDMDFREFLVDRFGERPVEVRGRMNAEMRCSADFSTNFFAVAKGRGRVVVHDGYLTDLPLFGGFSEQVRKVFPLFSAFSITGLSGDFTLSDGVFRSDNAYFGGRLISARGAGKYVPEKGFDALVRVRPLDKGWWAAPVRTATSPLSRLFTLELTGTLDNPKWRLDKYPRWMPFGGRKAKNEIPESNFIDP